MEQMVRRWPGQDAEDSIEAYLVDMEQLAIRHGLQRVLEAVAALRIDAKQRFFPRPDEVSAEIEQQRSERQIVAEALRSARLRQVRIKEFWEWAPQWMEDTGNSQGELLRRFPAFEGTEPEPAKA